MTKIELVSELSVQLIKSNAHDTDVARAAWVSTSSPEDIAKNAESPERVEKLISYLYRNKHMSPFEHGSMTFLIDCPIFVAREFMRHRTFSYNETSGRYKELEPRFWVPPKERPLVQTGAAAHYTLETGSVEQYNYTTKVLAEAYEQCWNGYQSLLRGGIAREVARDTLPVSTMTQFYATANPRNIMQFLELRTAPEALWEIRMVANAIDNLFARSMPVTHAAFKEGRTHE